MLRGVFFRWENLLKLKLDTEEEFYKVLKKELFCWKLENKTTESKLDFNWFKLIHLKCAHSISTSSSSNQSFSVLGLQTSCRLKLRYFQNCIKKEIYIYLLSFQFQNNAINGLNYILDWRLEINKINGSCYSPLLSNWKNYSNKNCVFSV